MTDQHKKALTVGVYAPFLQGFYYGELIGQIQQLCLIKGFRFRLIATHGLGEFSSPIQSSDLDIVILLRNAIHSDLAHLLLEQKKAVVAIAYDYFPLDIPVVGCDNELGVEYAFNFLLKRDHSEIAYIGDLSHYDLRKRYEAYCDQHEINGLPYSDERVFVVDNTLFSGGHSAAEEFTKRQCKADGIIVGGGLTAIGFSQRLRKIWPEKRETIDVVAFDAVSVIPAVEPNISVVDQNMVLIAHESLSKAEKILSGISPQRNRWVKPKLIPWDSELMDIRDAFLATSVELLELHRPNYMKTLLSNFYEWPQEIVKSKLDDLLMLQPIFPRYLHEACFSRVLYGKSGEEYTRLVKFISDSPNKVEDGQQQPTCKSAHYPYPLVPFAADRYNNSIHVTIFHQGRLWGVLSVFGKNEFCENLSSMVSLSGYLCTIADSIKYEFMVRKKEEQKDNKKDSSLVACNLEKQKGEIFWDAKENSATWDSKSLEMLGFVGDLEKNVYQHMEITDRIHVDDEDIVRSFFQDVNRKDMANRIRFKQKNKSYTEFDFICEREGENVRCSLEQLHEHD